MKQFRTLLNAPLVPLLLAAGFAWAGGTQESSGLDPADPPQRLFPGTRKDTSNPWDQYRKGLGSYLARVVAFIALLSLVAAVVWITAGNNQLFIYIDLCVSAILACCLLLRRHIKTAVMVAIIFVLLSQWQLPHLSAEVPSFSSSFRRRYANSLPVPGSISNTVALLLLCSLHVQLPTTGDELSYSEIKSRPLITTRTKATRAVPTRITANEERGQWLPARRGTHYRYLVTSCIRSAQKDVFCK